MYHCYFYIYFLIIQFIVIIIFNESSVAAYENTLYAMHEVVLILKCRTLSSAAAYVSKSLWFAATILCLVQEASMALQSYFIYYRGQSFAI